MTHNLITPQVLGNQPDKVLFRIDTNHASFPEFQKWAMSNAYRLSVGKDMLTLPKEKALEVVSVLNQKGWTNDTSENISQRIVSVSNSRVMSIASREALAAAQQQSAPQVNKKKVKAEDGAEATVH